MTSLYAFCVIVIVKYNRVSDSVRDAGSQLAGISPWEAFNEPGKFLFESVRILESELIRVVDHVAMVELGFDAAHGWGEVIAVQCTGALGVYARVLGVGHLGGGVDAGVVREGKLKFGQVRGRGLA